MFLRLHICSDVTNLPNDLLENVFNTRNVRFIFSFTTTNRKLIKKTTYDQRKPVHSHFALLQKTCEHHSFCLIKSSKSLTVVVFLSELIHSYPWVTMFYGTHSFKKKHFFHYFPCIFLVYDNGFGLFAAKWQAMGKLNCIQTNQSSLTFYKLQT